MTRADRDPASRPFASRHVVVTGGMGALGAAVVRRLLAAGAYCHVPTTAADRGRRPPPFGDHPRAYVAHGVDLRDEAATARFYQDLPALWASIHCAGGFAMAPIAETPGSAMRELLAMNVETCFHCCRQAIAKIRAGGDGGRLVNVAARPALEARGGAGMVAYTASKAAVAALTESLAEELAAEGIWVNAVVPSLLDTPANRAAMPDADHGSWPSLEAVAETIAFLASPANGVTRGALVPVYGRV